MFFPFSVKTSFPLLYFLCFIILVICLLYMVSLLKTSANDSDHVIAFSFLTLFSIFCFLHFTIVIFCSQKCSVILLVSLISMFWLVSPFLIDLFHRLSFSSTYVVCC